MDKPLNTNYIFEFEDKTTTELTLAFYKLYMLKGKNRNLYERYNQAMSRLGDKKNNSFDELDMIEILYVAYVCAHLDDYENTMNVETFMMKCGSDRMKAGQALAALTQPKN